MPLPIKFVAGSSTGVPFEIGETRSIVVTAEAVDVSSGYEGDSIIYTATVKDNLGGVLAATFVVDLEIDSTKVVTAQALSAGVYSQTTGLLTLPWAIPAAAGPFTVKLTWAEQLV